MSKKVPAKIRVYAHLLCHDIGQRGRDGSLQDKGIRDKVTFPGQPAGSNDDKNR